MDDLSAFAKLVRQCLDGPGCLNSYEWIDAYDLVFRQCAAEQQERVYGIAAAQLQQKAEAVCTAVMEQSACKQTMLNCYTDSLARFASSTATVHRMCEYLHRFWIPKQPPFECPTIDARAAAQCVVLIWRHCQSPLSVFPRDIIRIIAKMVYRSRTDASAWRCAGNKWKRSDTLRRRVCPMYELGLRCWNTLVLDKVFDDIAPVWACKDDAASYCRGELGAAAHAQFHDAIKCLYGEDRLPKKLRLDRDCL